jgi:hypothetical protein
VLFLLKRALHHNENPDAGEANVQAMEGMSEANSGHTGEVGTFASDRAS